MSSDSAPLLLVEHLDCGYPKRPVLRDVSFELHRGEILVLLGANGSGKTTLLKAIVRSVPAPPRTIFIQGEPLSSLSDRELALRVAYVPQQTYSVFDYTAREVVLMGRLAHSDGLFETAHDHEVAEQAMRDADCLEFADRPITELSGGEAQRVMIARALAQEATIFLLDEPTAHLDVRHQASTRSLMRSLAASGRGILVAVHDLSYAASIGDRALLLVKGALAASGPVAKVLASPHLCEAS